MKKLFILAILFGMCIQANATIIDTAVSAGMKIEYDRTNPSGPYLPDGEENRNGATAATADVYGAVTSIRTYSAIYLSPLSNESATVNFQIGWDSSAYSGYGYMGESATDKNYADITYHAVVDTILNYQWDFLYTDISEDPFGPFGLQYIKISQNGVWLNSLGNIPLETDPLSYTGSSIFSLIGGNDYTFRTSFSPNVYMWIGGIQGDLSGTVAYNFTPVPEPSTFLLLGGGLVGLVFVVRRKKES